MPPEGRGIEEFDGGRATDDGRGRRRRDTREQPLPRRARARHRTTRRALQAPPPIHAEMRVQRQLTGERDQEVLAARVDAHRLARLRMRLAEPRRLELGERVAAERAAQSRRGAVDRVALGHRQPRSTSPR
jgi:hypothetical protein